MSSPPRPLQPEAWCWHLLGLINPLIVIGGNLAGGPWVARLNLLSVLYLHFTTEHNRTHHKHVATPADPPSARSGESVWWFVTRTVPGQFLDAWRLHARRGHSVPTNPVARGAALQLLLLGGILVALGPVPLAAGRAGS
jgi:hypothetical protein